MGRRLKTPHHFSICHPQLSRNIHCNLLHYKLLLERQQLRRDYPMQSLCFVLEINISMDYCRHACLTGVCDPSIHAEFLSNVLFQSCQWHNLKSSFALFHSHQTEISQTDGFHWKQEVFLMTGCQFTDPAHTSNSASSSL